MNSVPCVIPAILSPYRMPDASPEICIVGTGMPPQIYNHDHNLDHKLDQKLDHNHDHNLGHNHDHNLDHNHDHNLGHNHNQKLGHNHDHNLGHNNNQKLDHRLWIIHVLTVGPDGASPPPDAVLADLHARIAAAFPVARIWLATDIHARDFFIMLELVKKRFINVVKDVIQVQFPGFIQFAAVQGYPAGAFYYPDRDNQLQRDRNPVVDRIINAPYLCTWFAPKLAVPRLAAPKHAAAKLAAPLAAQKFAAPNLAPKSLNGGPTDLADVYNRGVADGIRIAIESLKLLV